MDSCPDLAMHLATVQVHCAIAGSGHASADDLAALLAEIEALADCIASARRHLTALGAADIVSRHVPAAADELDAIVVHTGEATCIILDQCERIEEVTAGSAAQPAASVAVARIYEACSFQDITGQRVAKVVRTLQLVETRVQAILRVFAPGGAGTRVVPVPEPFLSGPQLPFHTMHQEAVDALLAETR